MYTLYSRPGSGGFVVEAALALAGAPYNVVNIVKGAPPPGYAEISPLNQVPALGLPRTTQFSRSSASRQSRISIALWRAQLPQASP